MAAIFMEATKTLPNVRYVHDDSITSLSQSEKNVDVTFAKASAETLDVVVAADGGQSRTRAMILDESVLKDCYRFIGQYIAYFSIPSQPDDPKLWRWYNAPKGLGLMLRPHRNPETQGAYLCITTPARETRDPVVEAALDKGPEEAKRVCHEYLDNAGWQAKRILAGMDTCDDFYMHKAAQVKLSKWANGRACVLGDAAHATFGVGTSLASEGAYLLAGELSKIQSSEDVPQALEKFEAVVRPLYSTMEELPPGFPQLAFPQTGWGLWIRDSLLWFVS